MFSRTLAVAVLMGVSVSAIPALAEQPLTHDTCMSLVSSELAQQGLGDYSIRIGTQVTIADYGTYTFTAGVTREYLCESIILPQDARMATLRQQIVVERALVQQADEARNTAVARLNAIQSDFVVRNAWGFAAAFGIIFVLFLSLVLVCLLLFFWIQIKRFRRNHRLGGIHGGLNRKSEPPLGPYP